MLVSLRDDLVPCWVLTLNYLISEVDLSGCLGSSDSASADKAFIFTVAQKTCITLHTVSYG